MLDLHVGRQTYDFDCGPKALQIVMAYYGVEVREDDLMEALRTSAEGTPVGAMISVAEAHGFEVRAGEGWGLAELKGYVDQGHPVIVLLQAWAERFMTLAAWRADEEDGHYAILIGHEEDVLIFEDPSSFRRTWLLEREFIARWHDRDTGSNRKLERFAMVLLGRAPVGKTLEPMR